MGGWVAREGFHRVVVACDNPGYDQAFVDPYLVSTGHEPLYYHADRETGERRWRQIVCTDERIAALHTPPDTYNVSGIWGKDAHQLYHVYAAFMLHKRERPVN